MDSLELASNGYSESNGGLNLNKFTLELSKKFPQYTSQIEKMKRSELNKFAKQLLQQGAPASNDKLVTIQVSPLTAFISTYGNEPSVFNDEDEYFNAKDTAIKEEFGDLPFILSFATENYLLDIPFAIDESIIVYAPNIGSHDVNMSDGLIVHSRNDRFITMRDIILAMVQSELFSKENLGDHIYFESIKPDPNQYDIFYTEFGS